MTLNSRADPVPRGSVPAEVVAAIAQARAHADAGLRLYPFDAVYRATLDQLAIVTASLLGDGPPLPAGRVTLGLMAAKELGNDERDFAHALHVIQHHVDAVTARATG